MADTEDGGWIIGVVICIFAAILSNAGLNVQKLAIDRSKADDSPGGIRRLWILGLVGIALGAVCDFAALAFAPQSIVAPLGALTLPTNILLAPLMHDEELVRSDVAWTFVILMGCVVSVKYASHENRDYDEAQLFAFFGASRFYVYMCTIISVVSLVLLLQRYIERQKKFVG
jgi:drug/metabolite transporter (DMT)-like permease